MNKILLLLFASILSLASPTYATDTSQSASDLSKVRAELSKLFPAAVDAEIVETDAPGVYRLAAQGSYAFAYVDGDFVLIGDLYNSRTKDNLGDLAQAEFLQSELDSYEEKMIVFGPKNAKHKITIFTDVTCYYCKKLHSEVPELNNAGIQVRYLMYPRQGLKSDGYKKNLAVWCNDDQQQAMTDAKADKTVPLTDCANPIAETFDFGRKVGVTGTPLILFEDGSRQPGYMPSAELIKRVVGSSAGGAE